MFNVQRAIACLFLLFSLCAQAKVIKVLAIGNSFSEDAVEQNLYELAKAQGDSLVIGNAYIPGCSIDRHLQNLRGDSAVYAYRKVVGGVKAERRKATLKSIIRDEQWDYISLQQASQLAGVPSTFGNLAQLKWLVETYVTNLHVQFLWHMTWAYAKNFDSDRFKAYGYNQYTMYRSIVSTMLGVLPNVGIHRVIPTGTAIQLMRFRVGDILNRDGYHLSLTLGRYTAACVWCEVLTGRIVDGNKFRPGFLTDEEIQVCQEEAHEAVFMQQNNRYAFL